MEIDSIRIAMVLDCEGWITLQKMAGTRGVGLCLTIGVGNTNPLLTDWLKTTFGGSVYKTRRNSFKHKDYYTWRLFGNNACEILKKAQPYMLLKRAQVELAVHFQETMHGKNAHNEPCTPEYVAYMWKLKAELNKLNRKGKDLPAETKCEDTKLELVSNSEAIVRTVVKATELDRNDLAAA